MVMSDVMARPQKHGEPTVRVTVRLPASLVEKLGSPLSGTIVKLLQDATQDVTTAEEEFIVSSNANSRTGICFHPKARQRQVVGGKRCLDCGIVT